MANFTIVTDSNCDLTEELLQQWQVRYTPMRYTVGGETLENHFDERLTAELYEKLRNGETATTSAANPADWEAAIEPVVAAGQDALVLVFSSGLSNSCQSTHIAAQELEERYPGRHVAVVDSLSASSGQGLLLYHAVQRQKEGCTLEETRQWVEENKYHVAHWFTVNDLLYLKRGGRISNSAALVGTVLQIKPVFHTDNDGHLTPVDKVRGRKKSMEAMVDRMVATAVNPEEQVVFISNGDCLEEAQQLANMVQERCHPKEIHIFSIGPVIGSHTGPGTLALFFLATER